MLLECEGRFVSLTGVGGCGKTRLAIHVASDLAESFSDGVALVELAALADPALVAHLVATLVGVPRRDKPMLQRLVAGLETRELLLVLDNCEHLVDACAELVDAVLMGCANVRVLATSREPLRIRQERTWRVPSLATPDLQQDQSSEFLARSPAVELFVERAQAVRQDFALTPRNAQVVARICVRLEGLPLAIELAAGRMRAIGVEQLREGFDENFRLLRGGSRTAPHRQRTLDATLDWSYELLSEEEKVLFRRLAVFTGGWSMEAAESVCADDDAGDSDDLLIWKGLSRGGAAARVVVGVRTWRR
jgi:non-specific serine/threonine protein kinase